MKRRFMLVTGMSVCLLGMGMALAQDEPPTPTLLPPPDTNF
jgi:hypothetical protein